VSLAACPISGDNESMLTKNPAEGIPNNWVRVQSTDKQGSFTPSRVTNKIKHLLSSLYSKIADHSTNATCELISHVHEVSDSLVINTSQNSSPRIVEGHPISTSTPEKHAESGLEAPKPIVTSPNDSLQSGSNVPVDANQEVNGSKKNTCSNCKLLQSKVAGLQQQIGALNATIASQQRGKNELKAKQSSLLSQISSLEISAANNDIELTSLRKVQQQNKSLSNTNRKYKSSIDKVGPLVQELSKECKELKAESSELKFNCKRNEIEAASLKKEAALLKNEAALLKENLMVAQAMLDSLNPEHLQATHQATGPSVNPIPVLVNGKCAPTRSQAKDFYSTHEKVKVRVIGDSTVRGLGQFMQSKSMDSTVVCMSGAGIDRVMKLSKDKWDEEVVALQCGVNDIGKQDLVHTINSFSDLIDITANKHPERQVIVNEIPNPSGRFSYDYRKLIADANMFLSSKCSKLKNTHFLPLNLKPSHMKGMHINNAGLRVIANKISNLIDNLKGQNFTRQEGIHSV
jgi:hypothetical protein